MPTVLEPPAAPLLIASPPPAVDAKSSPMLDKSVFVFPATLAQRRYWLLDQLQPGGNPALHMPIALRLRGELDSSLLQRAFNSVIARHESLRTKFESDRGQLRQLIAPSLQLDLKTQPPLDLVRGPLLRARLVRLAPQEHLLELAVHHIISDGWSNALLLRDLFAIYSASICGTRAQLPELPLQFADYAEWQEARLRADDFAAQRDYWRKKLAGELPGLDLPYQRSAARFEQTAETRSRYLPVPLALGAKTLATQENASAFMLYFAIFQTLLHRYTGQTDFLVTTPSANRDRAEFENVIGPFANPLILRAGLQGAPNFTELLARTRTLALEAFSQQDTPFEALFDEFQAARLQVNFHYDAGLRQPLELPPGLTSEFLATASAGSVYELSLSVLEETSGTRLEIEFNPARFDADTIERMLGHYEMLLRSALAEPAKPIAKLKLLSVAEEFSPVVPTDAPTIDLRAALMEQVRARPDAMLARHGRRELSCAGLLVRLEALPNPQEDLAHLATWIAHWRARLDTPLPPVATEDFADAAIRALQGRFSASDRIASVSHGAAAAEEIGAALLAQATLVYPTTELLADSAQAFATWLETEEISVACLPAALWNRLSATRKRRLRCVIVTEGDAAEGTFAQVQNLEDVAVVRRVVLPEANGTIALDDKPIVSQTRRLRVHDLRSAEQLPAGIAGELFIDQRASGILARRLPNELFEMLGPIAEQTYARGFRIDLRATEAALCTRPGVRQAIVKLTPAGCIAWLASESGMLPDAAALRRHLREQRLPNLAPISAFIPLKEISLNAEGHLDFSALPTSADALSEAPEPVRPYLGLQLQLIAIWEEVLGVRGIGIRDDFFDLGGNSLLALRMLQRAEVACGKTILPATLFRQPTIEHLAGEIAREARDESPTLLRVHDAGTRTPFFYLHGDLSGGGFYSLKLSRALGLDQPFYVLPPQDIRMLSAAPSIEEMAAEHLRALRAVRPKGPYVIGGFCIGGVVAYELAQQIKASGDEVERLLIIDASPDPTLRRMRWLAEKMGKLLRWKDEEMVAVFGRWSVWRARIAQRFAEGRQPRPARSVSDRMSNARGFLTRRFRPPPVATSGSMSEMLIKEERDLPSAFQWAFAAYRPRAYDGAVALLLSEDVLRDAENISRRWQELAPNVTVQPLLGSHLECITAHVETLAEKIEACLEKPA